MILEDYRACFFWMVSDILKWIGDWKPNCPLEKAADAVDYVVLLYFWLACWNYIGYLGYYYYLQEFYALLINKLNTMMIEFSVFIDIKVPSNQMGCGPNKIDYIA